MPRISSEALVIAYYLSRFDDNAYRALGYASKSTAHRELASKLNVNANSLKLRRDDFDPLHGHRVGWYQHKLSPRLHEVVQSLQGLTFDELTEIATGIVRPGIVFRTSSNGPTLLAAIDFPPPRRNLGYAPRGPTGRKAEEDFCKWHASRSLPHAGTLIDRRDHGGGYDYLLEGANSQSLIEVKGLDGENGNVTFTSKEWETAQSEASRYYLALVRGVWGKPVVELIHDPAHNLRATMQLSRPVQISWSVVFGARKLDP